MPSPAPAPSRIPVGLDETVTVRTGRRTEFRLRLPPRLFLVLVDEDGVPYANVPFTALCQGETLSGTTDEAGVVDVPLPIGASEVVLTHLTDPDDPESGTELAFALRAWSPASSVRGARERLCALGFDEASPSDSFDEAGLLALRAFQEFAGLPVSGTLDGATIALFDELYPHGQEA